MAYRAISDCAGKGSLFVVTIVAARRLSPDAFGVFSVASTLGWVLAVATDCGIQLHVARAVANRPAGAGEVLRRWLRVRLWTSAIAVATVAAVLAMAQVARREAAALMLLAAAYVASGVLEFLYYVYRGLGRTDLESTLTIAHRLAMLVTGMFALWWFGSVVALSAALLLPALVAVAVALRIASRLVNLQSDADRERDSPKSSPRAAQRPVATSDSAGLVSPRPTAWAEFTSEVLPIGAGIVLSAVYFRIDLFLVDRWMGTAAAGSYNAVFRLVEALRLFPAAVLAVLLPSLFRARTERTVVQVASALTLFGVAVAGAGLLVSAWLVPLLYGNAYAGAVPAFRVLLLSFPLLSLNYALTHQLIGWDGQRAYVGTCAAALVANVSLNAVLIPAEGISGAAWATFWTEMLLAASCTWHLWRIAPHRQRVAVAMAGA